MAWEGSCKQCGKCCTLDVNWLGFHDEESNQRQIEWATARGYEIKQIGYHLIQANFNHPCPHLIGNKCDIHKSKPEWCVVFPNGLEISADAYGLDIHKMLPEGCGFSWK